MSAQQNNNASCARIFAGAAPEYVAQSLPVFPAGGHDGKVPLIRNWQRIGLQAAKKLALRFPDANVAVLDGRNGGITRIDIDDPRLFDNCIRRFGDTPIKVKTPSGGVHLWFKANGERRIIGLEDEKIDILGKGGYGIAPPSVNLLKGCYEFLEGGLDDVAHLPVIRPGSLPSHVLDRGTSVNCPAPPSSSGGVHEGQRDKFLFREARHLALRCESYDGFMLQLRATNQTQCIPPLTDGEVAAKAKYVWRLKEEGRCFPSGMAFASISQVDGQALYQYPPALALLHFLKCNHAPHHEFAVSPKGLEIRLQSNARTIAKARDFLLKQGCLHLIHKGGRGEGDADRFRFC